MAIPLTCPSCDHEFKVKDELAGKRIKCPKCKEAMKVQSAEDEREPEEEERPKKKKKKKGKKDNRVLIGSVIGGGVIIVVAILVFVLTRGSNADQNQNKIVQKKGGKPAPVPVAKAEEPDEEPKPAKKGPASSAGRIRDRIEIENTMKQIGIAYNQFEALNNRGPSDIKELGLNVAKMNEMLTDKTITFIWNINSRSFPDGKSNTIIAYETDADSNGNRIVLNADGSVHAVGEGDFQKAPKAKGK
jgi:hypothetical protein